MTDYSQRIISWPRFAAALIDLAVAAIVGSAVGLTLGPALSGIVKDTNIDIYIRDITGISSGFVLGIIIVCIINALLEGFVGASVGKLKMRISISDAYGSKASQLQLWSRLIIKNVSFVCITIAIILQAKTFSVVGSVLGLIILLGYFGLLSQSRQALHDRISKTAIYRR